MDKLEDWRRTHFSSEITPNLDGQTVTVFGWVQTVRDLGKMKFIVLSDREGEIQITVPAKTVSQTVNIPVIASGGAGNPEHIYKVLTEGMADAALAASIFHRFQYPIRKVKEYLAKRGVHVRLV